MRVNVGMYWNSICATSGAPVPAFKRRTQLGVLRLALTGVDHLDLDRRVLLLEERHLLLDVRHPGPERQLGRGLHRLVDVGLAGRPAEPRRRRRRRHRRRKRSAQARRPTSARRATSGTDETIESSCERPLDRGWARGHAWGRHPLSALRCRSLSTIDAARGVAAGVRLPRQPGRMRAAAGRRPCGPSVRPGSGSVEANPNGSPGRWWRRSGGRRTIATGSSGTPGASHPASMLHEAFEALPRRGRRTAAARWSAAE